MNDNRVAELLDGLTPSYADRAGDWERVVADARVRPTAASRRRYSRLIALLPAALILAAIVLAWPFASNRPGLLERARAAIGDGPVLHVVLRGEWGGTLVNLASGEHTPVYGEDEVWFDTESGQTHTIQRLGTVVQDDELSVPKKPPAELAALGREYRQALESGTARIAGEDEIDGQAVVWITIHSELLPDVSDGKDHEWAQQVAISKATYKPVALRETRDGRPGPGTLQRVLELETLSRADANLTRSGPSLDGAAFREGREAISRGEAAVVLGRTPLWLGDVYDGLRLAQVYRDTTSVGRQRRDGATRWTDERNAVLFFYGTVGGGPITFRGVGVPLYDKPYVAVSEATQAAPFRPGVGRYVPPEGSVFIAAGGGTGFLQRDGLQIAINARTSEAVVAAARALTPMP